MSGFPVSRFINVYRAARLVVRHPTALLLIVPNLKCMISDPPMLIVIRNTSGLDTRWLSVA